MTENTNALRTLTKAILEKRCVAIRCDERSRLIAIEPHAVYSDANNNIILDFYQLPGVTGESVGFGLWNSITWRKIDAVFWLNTSFEPRLKQGFDPALDKYRTGLLAIVKSGGKLKDSKILRETIDASIEQVLEQDAAQNKPH